MLEGLPLSFSIGIEVGEFPLASSIGVGEFPLTSSIGVGVGEFEKNAGVLSGGTDGALFVSLPPLNRIVYRLTYFLYHFPHHFGNKSCPPVLRLCPTFDALFVVVRSVFAPGREAINFYGWSFSYPFRPLYE